MKSYPKYLFLTSGWFVLMYFVFSGFTYKADFKVGFVFTDRIWAQYKDAIDANEKIGAEQQELEKQMIAKQEDFETMAKDYESKQLMYSDTKKAEIEQTLTTLRTELLTFQQENFDPNTGVLANKWIELMKPIIESVQAVIDKYGSDEGYDLILEHKDQIPIILYARDEIDITDEILEELKKQQPR